jgi:hypothetical protein
MQAAAEAAAANGYHVLRRVGSGVYGEVFLATTSAGGGGTTSQCCIKRVPVAGAAAHVARNFVT